MNCNKVKALKVGGEEIAEACVDSEELEVSEDKLKIRRKENRVLPPQSIERKRDSKAHSKTDDVNNRRYRAPEDGRIDDKGMFFSERDFNDP